MIGPFCETTTDSLRMTEGLWRDLVDLRRQLHRRPELAMREFETTATLQEWLHQRGLPFHVTAAGTGGWCDIGRCESPVALRGDIDALPIATELATDYRSEVGGLMHACGHDAHATMVCGAMVLLAGWSSERAGQGFRGILQPAEENSLGGPFMIGQGALNRVRAIFALHVDPSLNCGVLACRRGAMTASCDVLTATFHGHGGHSARPHLTSDLIAAAAHWVDSCLARGPRSVDSRLASVLSFGSIHGGSAANILPTTVQIQGTLRCLAPSHRDRLLVVYEQLGAAIAANHQASFELTVSGYTPPVINDLRLTEMVTRTIAEDMQGIAFENLELPSMGAEDFAFMTQKVPGCMLRIGVGNSRSETAALHTPSFDIDERALGIGAECLARIAAAAAVSQSF